MSNPFKVLDLSDDEGITVVPKAPAAAEAKPAKIPQSKANSSKPPQHKQPRAELRKEEAALQQKKKGPPGPRGSVPQPEVAHPGERSKIGLKKEPHQSTHKHIDPAAPVNSRGGRMFDRHSGTGRGKEGKKQGGGGHNWGKPGDEAIPEGASEEKKEGEASDAAAAAAPAVPVVEEEPQMTLEEFEAMKQAKRSGDAFKVKEVRKVTAEPALQVLKKDEENDNYIKLGEDHEQKKKPGHFKVKPAKQVMEIDFKIARDPEPSNPSPRGFGRGRGGASSRGGGARDSRPPRAARDPAAPRQAPINVADSTAFPKLGGA